MGIGERTAGRFRWGVEGVLACWLAFCVTVGLAGGRELLFVIVIVMGITKEKEKEKESKVAWTGAWMGAFASMAFYSISGLKMGCWVCGEECRYLGF